MSLFTKILLGVLSIFLLAFLFAAGRASSFPAFLEKYRRNGIAQASRQQIVATVVIVLILFVAVLLSGRE